MSSNTIELNRSEITISQVEEYLNYLQPYQGEKVEPTVNSDSKQCAIAIRKEFQGFEGMLYITNEYFYKNSGCEKITMIFDRLSKHLYPLVNDMVETRLQSNWQLFFQALISEAFIKSNPQYPESYRTDIHSYLNRDLSVNGLKDLLEAKDFGWTKSFDFSSLSLATAIKAELIYALQYSMSGNLAV